MIKGLWATAGVCFKQVFDGTPLQLCTEYAVRLIRLCVLILVWRALGGAGVDLGGMTLPQLLTYTLMAAVLRQQLEIITPATSALWEGSIIGRYVRPVPVLQSFVAETVGRHWLPVFLLFSLPVWLLAPLFGVNPLPASLTRAVWFMLSLVFSAAIGFAVDFLFAALAMRMKNGCWAALQVREAIFALFSGALLPFSLMPWGLGRVFELLPLGSIASAPLTIYVGLGDPLRLVTLQLFWCAVLWAAALTVYRRSEERMISFGG